MFPESLQFHVAPSIDLFVNWLTVTGSPVSGAISHGTLAVLLNIQAFFMFIPWWLWIVVVASIRWWQTRKVAGTAGLILLLLSIGAFGLWRDAIDTLAVVLTAVVIAFIIGIPLGIIMATSNRANAVLSPLLDGMQTMPSFVYLIPALMIFGLGKVPAVFATLIYAVPPLVRLTNLGIRQVSSSVQEAATAFGATRWQLMREVRLPLAMPSILAGLNQTTMMALAMVVIASMIGAGGLGEKVLIDVNRIDVGKGFEAGFAVVALAIIIDRLTQGLVHRGTHT
ncbi:Binding-protein-dependent transport system inner membrane component [Acididesulfobacillus acetoxydans]|uniref:Binding-protein-dependent transport system inner membrane component n=1 Tax=Acididesulfobacillus acetoxydans TaxID=1561005 RepID=A0A8S0WRP5_9FIRM|nr:ABC transporter permease subunit [Acididesulfobacillus acetoxydans]CAA7603434.1 Binding-protein-dependent transport system inner membrane component [Acididesulfobacillus acetoxydans]CEJ07151.1 Glycine betaine/carnitine transport permease protein GbuB [Acididesulfobacillus acetoxydans]